MSIDLVVINSRILSEGKYYGFSVMSTSVGDVGSKNAELKDMEETLNIPLSFVIQGKI